MGSARTVTGVGPRFCFTFSGTGGVGVTNLSVDNHIGTVTAWRQPGSAGVYGVEHNYGSTAYAVNINCERTADVWGNVTINYRGTTGCTFEVRDLGANAIDPSFVHCTIHDAGG